MSSLQCYIGARNPIGTENLIYHAVAAPSSRKCRIIAGNTDIGDKRFPDQMAKAGCDAILKMLRGDEAERETIVPVKLVKRESSC